MNQRKKILIWEIVGCVIVMASTFLFHFLYELTNFNEFVGYFSPINESIFQHTKIAFVPYILFSIIEAFFVDIGLTRFITVKSIISLSVFAFIIVFYYTYTGILGYDVPWLNIVSVLLFIILATYISYKLLTGKRKIERLFFLAFPLFLVAFICMLVFTHTPPEIPLFFDPLNKTYSAVKK